MEKRPSSTRQRERPTLGFLTPGLQVDSRQYQVWVGSVEAACEREVNLITFSVGRLYNEASQLENKRKALQDLITTERLDGLITFEWWDAEQFQHVCARYRPLPIVNVMQQIDGYHCVLLDFHDLMPVKMRHLIEDHGYRRIAYVLGNDTSFILRVQAEAYQDILHSYGLPLDPALVVPYPLPTLPERDSGAYFLRGKEAIRILLDERQLRPGRDIEAIMGWSDALGWGMLEALHERGVRVPYDVAVMGSGGEDASRFSVPPLTTTAPPYYQMGRKAVEMMLSIVAGEPVEESTVLPVGLHLRRSCGCLDPSIIRAKAGTLRNPIKPFEVMVSDRRTRILTAMEQATDGRWSCAGDWADQLLTAFVAELNASSRSRTEKGEFIPTLEAILYHVDRSGSDVNLGQDALSALHAHLFSSLSADGDLLGQAESLWQQGRVLIHHISRQSDMRKQAQKDRHATVLRAIGRQLINTFDVRGVIDVLAEGLPRLEVPACYLSLYENPAAPGEGARLRLAYNTQGRIAPGPEGRLFPSLQIVPDGLLPTERALSLIVESLHFGDEPIGFVVFETAPQHERTIYDILRGEISSALQGALLLGKVTRQKYILDTFMENVPDSIYFKDRDSRITYTNPAFARCIGCSDPADLIGKNDFDFFPERHARTKYEQEQEILRTGTPIFAQEETDDRGRWALATKMPLRDENNDIIGTFGISRDITELKQTQQGLEDAYTEIHVLNERLKDENLRMGAEMELAHRIQTSLLPMQVNKVHPDFEIAAAMLPADEVGGDYYDIAYDLEQNLWFSIGDVSGHGVTPGLIMMMAQTIHTAIITNYHVSPKEMVIGLNKALYHNVSDRLATEHFMTFNSLKYLGHGRFQHAGAHLDLLVYRQHRQYCELIETPGTFLNFIPDISHATANAEFSLDVGDLLVLYTDGLTEAFNQYKELFDIHRFQEIIRRHAHENVEHLKESVFQEVLRWCDGKRTDDMSLVVVRRVR